MEATTPVVPENQTRQRASSWVEIRDAQKKFFESGATLNINFRKSCLQLLLKYVDDNETRIVEALYKDFKKPAFESVLSETGLVKAELRLFLKKIKTWSATRRLRSSLLNFPSRARIYPEPYGGVLIISPWNYPFQLALMPVIGAVAAGNTVVLKPSENSPATSAVVKEILEAVFEDKHVAVFEGGPDISESLLEERWDYIFFTGSVQTGKKVAVAAAPFLTPCTLELGGKNPCVVDETANIKLAAKRIVWGKFLNAGQTCIAPDYVLVHQSTKEALVTHLIRNIKIAYGENAEDSEDFARIINQRHYNRLKHLLDKEEILYGGEFTDQTFFISPTLINQSKTDSAIMKDEIFGPVLPIISYKTEADIKQWIDRHEKPLAFYIFSGSSSRIRHLISKFSFGGGTVNDTVVHFVNNRLPFGGVGHSGTGAYHGKHSFYTFSHLKSVVIRGTWMDIPVRYAPYKGKLKLIKTFLRYF